MKTKLVKAAGRFGARYGQYVRRRIADLESKQRQKQRCPICMGVAKRLSKGIWKCRKCRNKFAAHAFFLDEDSLRMKQDKIRQFISRNKLVAVPEKQEKESKPLKEAKANSNKSKLSKKSGEKPKNK